MVERKNSNRLFAAKVPSLLNVQNQRYKAILIKMDFPGPERLVIRYLLVSAKFSDY